MQLHVEAGSSAQAIIGHHGGGALNDGAQPLVRRGFAAWELEDVSGAQFVDGRLHLRDAFEYERVEAVAGGWVGAGEALEADQRQVHPVSRLGRVEQGMVGFYPTIPAAPIEDVPAAPADGLVIECAHAFVQPAHDHGILDSRLQAAATIKLRMRAWNRAKLLWGYLTRRARVDALPVEYIVETTAKCNLYCPMCPGKPIPNPKRT